MNLNLTFHLWNADKVTEWEPMEPLLLASICNSNLGGHSGFVADDYDANKFHIQRSNYDQDDKS